MSIYKLTTGTSIIRVADGACIPDDPANRDYEEYLDWLDAGNTPDPYVAPPPPPITSVTPRQARLALLGAGALDQVEAAVKAAGGATLITWEYASAFERHDPLISAIGSQLNMSEAQIDALFAQAATL